MMGFCVGVELDMPTTGGLKAGDNSGYRYGSARSQLKARGKKARFSHTLCTSGADAARARTRLSHWVEARFLLTTLFTLEQSVEDSVSRGYEKAEIEQGFRALAPVYSWYC
jgi:hypothetical protein